MIADLEPYPAMKDSGVPFKALLHREVLPHPTDAWYVPDGVKTGYKVSFTRYFYQPQPLRTLEAIRADILRAGEGEQGAAGRNQR